jgi:hypothetical protein
VIGVSTGLRIWLIEMSTACADWIEQLPCQFEQFFDTSVSTTAIRCLYDFTHCPQIDFVDQYIGWNCRGFHVVLKWENGIDSVKVQCYYFLLIGIELCGT